MKRILSYIFVFILGGVSTFGLLLLLPQGNNTQQTFTPQSYPEIVKTGFVNECNAKEGNYPEFCSCVINELEKTMYLGDLITYANGPEDPKPKQFTDAQTLCNEKKRNGK